MTFFPVIRPTYWGVLGGLVVLSLWGVCSSFLGGLMMLIGAAWLCPVHWRRFGMCFRRSGHRREVSPLPVLLFILGGYISMAERDAVNVESQGLWHFRGIGGYVLTRDANVRRQAAGLIRQVLDQDYLAALIGGKLVRQESLILSPVELMSSAELARLYWGEEVAVPRVIGRNVLITGTVLSVRRDDPTGVTLEFPGFGGLKVLAELQDGSAMHFASLQEGRAMEVFCSLRGKDGGSGASSIYLSGCAEVEFVLDAWAYSDHLTEASRGWQEWFDLLAQNGQTLLRFH